MKLRFRRLLGGLASWPSSAAAGGVAVLMLVGTVAWYATSGGTLRTLHVSGNTILSADSVRTLTGLQTGQPLRAVSSDQTSRRLDRHPWIERSSVQVRPFRNRVDVQVHEHTPRGRWVAPDGTPRFFLDTDGHALPPRPDTTFDVPLVYDDSVSYHESQPAVRPATQQALRALAAADTVRALVSGLRTASDQAVDLYMTHPNGYTVTVHLGRGNYVSKLQRLEAFHTHVLPHTLDSTRTIDLRFAEQVVTRP